MNGFNFEKKKKEKNKRINNMKMRTCVAWDY